MSKKTIFVAVHGIGDQVLNESIQSVAWQVYERYLPQEAPPALGAFFSTGGEAYFPPGAECEELGEVGFAEVYWADKVREPAREGYTLEEAKRWAMALVQRLRAEQKKKDTPARQQIDYDLLQQVLSEIIETIAVTDRLVGLARKANLGSFHLKRILDDFLGDVQFFTDFAHYRSEIVGCFNEKLEKIHKDHKDADIVLVAHSEGTVVAFTGLLYAAAGKDASGQDIASRNAEEHDVGDREVEDQQATTSSGWLGQVRALMTIGSPIDKHLILWPDIWQGIEGPKQPQEEPIVWCNYYDYGDPVGFELNTARKVLRDRGFLAPAGASARPGYLFKFDDDHGFTRYAFPGKAHVDYWTDKEVFGHFFDALAPKATAAAEHEARPQPRTKPGAFVVSYLIPYPALFAVLLLAVYALTAGAYESGLVVTELGGKNLLGYTSLLAGITLLARVPRLVRKWWRWLVGGGAMALAAFAYKELVHPPLLLPFALPSALPVDHVVISGVLVALASFFLSKARWGMKPLVIIGSAVAVLLLGLNTWAAKEHQKEQMEAAAVVAAEAPAEAPADDTGEEKAGPEDKEKRSIFPVLIGAAFFLYLWWFAALLFDLVFVWHRNIRHSAFIPSG